jgi:hypothetical protein
MKFILKVIIIGVLVYFAGPHLGWWWIAVAAFIGGVLVKTTGFQSFFAGAFGVGIIWLWVALKIDIATESILTDKMADLFNLGHKGFIIGITVLLGSLVGALSCWSGHNFRKLFETQRRRGYYR